MANVGLDGPNIKWVVGTSVRRKHGRYGRDFERVSRWSAYVELSQYQSFGGLAFDEQRTCAVCLEESCFSRVQPSFGIHLTNQCFLRQSTGCRDCLGLAVLVQACVPDDGPDGISIPQGIVQSLDNDGGGALAATIATGSTVESEASALRREKALCMSTCLFNTKQNLDNLLQGRHGNENVRVDHDVRTTNNAHVALAGP